MEKLKEKNPEESSDKNCHPKENEDLNMKKVKKMFGDLDIDKELSGLFYNSIKLFFELGRELTENLDEELYDKALKMYQQKKNKKEKSNI
ncbi:MAG: hypothetical protein R6U96_05605 [Promethearchaeia archaeon]